MAKFKNFSNPDINNYFRMWIILLMLYLVVDYIVI